MTTDNNIVDGLKDIFFKWAITKQYTNRICWSGNALTDKYKVEPWFKVTNVPMQPDNRFRATWYSGILTVDVLVKAATGLNVILTVSDEVLRIFPVQGYSFNGQHYSIYKSYKDAEQTEGSYLIMPIRIFYEGTVPETD